jgi:hypothetical protein
MSEASTAALDRECTVFTRYLVGGNPTDGLRLAYRRGHDSIPFRRNDDRSSAPLDQWALRVARLGSPGVRAADAYHRFFHPFGALRQKLTLLLAILEHAPPFHVDLNRGVGGGPLRAVIGLAGVGFVFGLSLIGGVVVLGPVHLWSRALSIRAGRTNRRGDARE